MNIGANIKKFRKEKALTQKDLAEITGISISAIEKYERGRLNPSLGKIESIANALDVTIQELKPGEKQQVKNITQFSTDELLKEIVKRGFEITLKGR
ncbi:helix-turn-helix family protein [[Clostridium] bifermentans ATCC 19299]|uniref:helix-turn-helix domain-containing protein n=1 Tax=Paraclostridium bifermentans TaxID=1490 RepID=UPI00038CD8BD|nr:helix-turn-helix transcriptional regulator [Paraclostridium bifermentans]EQK47041.1 helix-turn-helix family protein [[Clostridium] bifermentans ATCC 19299] [Paraclostridium bifermentans ATCC 19299]